MIEYSKMKDAYGYLYKIENAIRAYIEYKMEKEYGIHWFHTAPRKGLWKNCKKPRTRVRNLIRLKVPYGKAYEWGNT